MKSPMIIDSHAHIFSSRVIRNVSGKAGLAEELHLDTRRAARRTTIESLEMESRAADVSACLLLPTATEEAVSKVNQAFQEMVKEKDHLHAAGTLHPRYPHNREELLRLKRLGCSALKLCSFSQGFDLAAPETRRLFDLIRAVNETGEHRFFVVLDTFFKADLYFGTPARNNTTPARLSALAGLYPDIDFAAAHMGGLAAPFSEILDHLPPRENLYLETSNASHTLREEEFVRLLELHGPGHILFGTDWPWFSHRDEVQRIRGLLDLAGYGEKDQALVFSGNIAGLLGRAPRGGESPGRLDSP